MMSLLLLNELKECFVGAQGYSSSRLFTECAQKKKNNEDGVEKWNKNVLELGNQKKKKVETENQATQQH